MKLPGNMQDMMKQAQQMQAKMQEEIAPIRVEATAGGGMVTVKMDGQKNCSASRSTPKRPATSRCCRTWCWPPATKPSRRWTSRRSKDRRHARRHGPASRTVLTHARLRRAARAADPGVQAPARHRPEVGAAHRVPRPALGPRRRRAARPGAARRQGQARPLHASATTSATASCVPTAATRTATTA